MFLSLNEHDFTRLGLTTKMIKTIQKIQTQYRNYDETKSTEEWLEDTMVDADYHEQADVSRRVINANNPYEGIILEQV